MQNRTKDELKQKTDFINKCNKLANRIEQEKNLDYAKHAQFFDKIRPLFFADNEFETNCKKLGISLVINKTPSGKIIYELKEKKNKTPIILRTFSVQHSPSTLIMHPSGQQILQKPADKSASLAAQPKKRKRQDEHTKKDKRAKKKRKVAHQSEKKSRISQKNSINFSYIFTETAKLAKEKFRGKFAKALPIITQREIGESLDLEQFQIRCQEYHYKLVVFNVLEDKSTLRKRYELFDSEYKQIKYTGRPYLDIVPNKYSVPFKISDFPLSYEKLIALFNDICQRANTIRTKVRTPKHPEIFIQAILYTTMVHLDRQLSYSELKDLFKSHGLDIFAYRYNQVGIKYKFVLVDKGKKEIASFGPLNINGELIPNFNGDPTASNKKPSPRANAHAASSAKQSAKKRSRKKITKEEPSIDIPKLFNAIKKKAQYSFTGNFESVISTVTQELYEKTLNLEELEELCSKHQYKIVKFKIDQEYVKKGKEKSTTRYDLFHLVDGRYEHVSTYPGHKADDILLEKNKRKFKVSDFTLTKTEMINLFNEIVDKANGYAMAAYNKNKVKENKLIHPNYFNKAIPYATKVRLDRQLNYLELEQLCKRCHLEILVYEYRHKHGVKLKFDLVENKEVLASSNPGNKKGQKLIVYKGQKLLVYTGENENITSNSNPNLEDENSESATTHPKKNKKRKKSANSNKDYRQRKKRKLDLERDSNLESDESGHEESDEHSEKSSKHSRTESVDIPELFAKIKEKARKSYSRTLEKAIPNVMGNDLGPETNVETLEQHCAKHQYKLVTFEVPEYGRGDEKSNKRYELFDSDFTQINTYPIAKHADIILEKKSKPFNESDFHLTEKELKDLFNHIKQKAKSYQKRKFNQHATKEFKHSCPFIKAIPYATKVRFDIQLDYSELKRLYQANGMDILAYKYNKNNETYMRFDLVKNKKTIMLFGHPDVQGKLIPNYSGEDIESESNSESDYDSDDNSDDDSDETPDSNVSLGDSPTEQYDNATNTASDECCNEEMAEEISAESLSTPVTPRFEDELMMSEEISVESLSTPVTPRFEDDFLMAEEINTEELNPPSNISLNPISPIKRIAAKSPRSTMSTGGFFAHPSSTRSTTTDPNFVRENSSANVAITENEALPSNQISILVANKSNSEGEKNQESKSVPKRIKLIFSRKPPQPHQEEAKPQPALTLSATTDPNFVSADPPSIETANPQNIAPVSMQDSELFSFDDDLTGPNLDIGIDYSNDLFNDYNSIPHWTYSSLTFFSPRRENNPQVQNNSASSFNNTDATVSDKDILDIYLNDPPKTPRP